VLVKRNRDSGSARGRRPVRMLTLTTLFPNSQQPRHGIFIANRLRRMCATGRVEATVIAAVPTFPGYYREFAEVPAREPIEGFDVHHPRYVNWPKIGMRRQPDALASALLRSLRSPALAGRRFDVIDAHYFYPDGVAAALVARALHLPFIVSARGSDINRIGEFAFARQRMRRAALQSASVIAVSQALKERLAALGIADSNVTVLRNGVDTATFAAVERAAARERLGLDPSCTLVLAVANLVPEKGLDVLLRAAGRHPSWRVLVIGEGSERDALRKLARREAPGRVEFRDSMPQADLRYAYAAANALALPSLREGWPNVLLEAMACGTPVAAAAVGGVPEIVQPHAPGVVVEGRDSGAWGDALAGLVARSWPQAAVREYAMGFGWDEIVDRQCGLLEAVARQERAAAAARERDLVPLAARR
jgi:glycosyltransferase involved in cell wall biosynthesis